MEASSLHAFLDEALESPTQSTRTPTQSSSAGSASASAYASVRERLVQLTVEIDDQERAAALLESALEKETAAGEQERAEAEEADRAASEAREKEQREQLAGLLESVDQELARKKELSLEVKRLGRELRALEDETASAVASVRESARQELDAARATWEEGAPARREKWLQQQTREIRELTVKGLEPEIQRLLEKHKHDCAEEERAKREAELALVNELAEELDKAKVDQETRARARWAALDAEECESFERQCHALQEEHSRRLRAAQQALTDEREARQREFALELQRLRQDQDDALADARAHEATRHAELCRKLDDERAKAVQQREARSADEGARADAENEAWLSEQRRLAHERAREHVAECCDRLAAERDAAIEREIRKLQSERTEMERDLRSPHLEEKRAAQQAHLQQLQALKAKRAGWVEKHVAAMAQQQQTREMTAQLAEQIAEAEAALKAAQAELAEATLENEAEGARLAESEHDLEREDEEALSSLVARRDELQQQLETEHASLDEANEAHAAAIDEKRAAHEKTLSSLQESVRSRVAEKEQELQAVRDALETEQLRSEHIERLRQKYTRAKKEEAAAPTSDPPPASSASQRSTVRRPAANGRGAGAQQRSSAPQNGARPTARRAAASGASERGRAS